MAKTVQTTIICDGCGKDISPRDTAYPHQYILRLAPVDVGINTGNIVYGIAMSPPIKGELYFCGIGCVGLWADEIKRAAEAREAERKGFKITGNTSISQLTPPFEVT